MEASGHEGPRGDPTDPESAGQEPALVALARYSGHGLTLAMAMGLFMLAGWWVDGRLGTTPVLTILGALVGAGAGFYHMLHHVLFLPRAEAEERARKGRGDVE